MKLANDPRIDKGDFKSWIIDFNKKVNGIIKPNIPYYEILVETDPYAYIHFMEQEGFIPQDKSNYPFWIIDNTIGIYHQTGDIKLSVDSELFIAYILGKSLHEGTIHFT